VPVTLGHELEEAVSGLRFVDGVGGATKAPLLADHVDHFFDALVFEFTKKPTLST
jgi:hypothetical protein